MNNRNKVVYLYRRTERERFKINIFVFQYGNDKCFSIYISKSHDHLTTGHFTVPRGVKEINSETNFNYAYMSDLESINGSKTVKDPVYDVIGDIEKMLYLLKNRHHMESSMFHKNVIIVSK